MIVIRLLRIDTAQPSRIWLVDARTCRFEELKASLWCAVVRAGSEAGEMTWQR